MQHAQIFSIMVHNHIHTVGQLNCMLHKRTGNKSLLSIDHRKCIIITKLLVLSKIVLKVEIKV